MQPPWSTATSTTTLPSCISLISFSLTSLGALAPGMSTPPITRSAERTLSVVGLDGLVRHRRDLALQQRLGQRLVGREMEVRVYGLPFAHEPVLAGDRLLHLHDHLGARPDVSGLLHDLRAGGLVGGVGDPAAQARALFDQHLVPAPGERGGSAGNEPDAVLAGFDFLRRAAAHVCSGTVSLSE